MPTLMFYVAARVRKWPVTCIDKCDNKGKGTKVPFMIHYGAARPLFSRTKLEKNSVFVSFAINMASQCQKLSRSVIDEIGKVNYRMIPIG